ANYFRMLMQQRLYSSFQVYFQKFSKGELAGGFSSGITTKVYLKIHREANEYSGYFANADPVKPEDIDKIQWTGLGTLPWIRFQPKLSLCAVNFQSAPEVVAEFYSV